MSVNLGAGESNRLRDAFDLIWRFGGVALAGVSVAHGLDSAEFATVDKFGLFQQARGGCGQDDLGDFPVLAAPDGGTFAGDEDAGSGANGAIGFFGEDVE